MPCSAGRTPRRWSEVSGEPADGRTPDSPQSPGVQVPAHAGSPLPRRSAFTRLGAAVARYHRLVVAVWVVVVVGSALLVPRFQSSVTGPPLDVGAYDSYQAQENLRTRFDQPFAEQDL